MLTCWALDAELHCEPALALLLFSDPARQSSLHRSRRHCPSPEQCMGSSWSCLQLVVGCLRKVSQLSFLLAAAESRPRTDLLRVGLLRQVLRQELRQTLRQELRQAVEHSGLALAALALTAWALAEPVLLVQACCHTWGASLTR